MLYATFYKMKADTETISKTEFSTEYEEEYYECKFDEQYEGEEWTPSYFKILIPV